MPVLTRDEAQTRARQIDVQSYAVDLDLTGEGGVGGEGGDAGGGEGGDGGTFASRTVIRFTVHAPGDGPGGIGTVGAGTDDADTDSAASAVDSAEDASAADSAPAPATSAAAPTTIDTFVELKPAALRSVILDGRALDPAALTENRYPLTALAPGAHELRVDATMHYSRTGEGMHRFTDPADGETYVYTQLFLDDVQRVFAAFDQPDLKSVFEVTVTAPTGWTVLGNGVATHQGDGRWTLAPTPLIATYLVAVAAGPWHSVTTEHAGLPFGIHCRRSLAPHLDADADEILSLTRACFDRFHEKFDEPYPFDSYDQAFVPEFNAGAMENPGLVTFRDNYVFQSAVTDTQRQSRGVTIAHEMAHMWFGDLVTLRWWDDIWLNESFAEYMGYQTLAEATRFTDTWTGFAVSRKGWGYDADQRPSTHPVAPDPEAVPDTASALLNFDGISYAKGASALRQLVAWMGEKDFLVGINTHIARHKFGNATLADFIDNLASATDRDVHAWAESWLRTTGVDTLTPEVTDTEAGWQLNITHTGTRPHRVTVGAYDRDLVDPDALVLRERFELDLSPAGPAGSSAVLAEDAAGPADAVAGTADAAAGPAGVAAGLAENAAADRTGPAGADTVAGATGQAGVVSPASEIAPDGLASETALVGPASEIAPVSPVDMVSSVSPANAAEGTAEDAAASASSLPGTESESGPSASAPAPASASAPAPTSAPASAPTPTPTPTPSPTVHTFPPRPGRRPALLLLNDGDQTYAKVRLDPHSWNTALRALSGVSDIPPDAAPLGSSGGGPLTRAVVWNAARDMVRDGQLPPADYLDAARAHLPYETDLAVVQGVLAFAADQIADRYLAPAERPAALAVLTDLCRDLIRRTEDGNHPGLRLTAVRHFIAAASQPDSIRDWYDSGSVPGGPALDPELRWSILYRLAVLGATDEAAIAAELDRDSSATGQEGAARCRAALPTPQAKAAAWERLFTDDSLSNYLFAATAQGFWQPEQSDLTRDYVTRFYRDATALAARRGPAIADAAGRYAFPAHAVDADSLALGESHLAAPDLTPALRRKLVDQCDDLARALAVRAG